MPDLYAARLDAIALEIEVADDEIEKAIVRHEYPYRNGALLEDLGQGARIVRISCHFWDDDGDHQTYAAHLDLLAYLQGLDIGELIHPNYGPMRGRVESVHLHHDTGDHVQLDLVFVEQLIEATEETPAEDVESAAESAYADSIEDQLATLTADMGAALGAEATSILEFGLDDALGIVEQFSGISTTARNYLKKVESYVATLEGTLSAVANPANGLVSILNYGTGLPGRVIGSLARCFERYALMSDALRTAPDRYADNLSWSLDELTAVSGDFGKTTRIGGAAAIALQTAYCYKDDENRRRKIRKTEGQTAFDLLGNYRPPATAADNDRQPMTVRELESSLATVRGLLQEAVDMSRQSGSLKRLAWHLQHHVWNIKLERERTVRVRLDNRLPLHIVCLMHGLPHTAAERLLALNDQIRNPNEVAGEMAMVADGAFVSRAVVATAVEIGKGREVRFGGDGVTFGGEEITFGSGVAASAAMRNEMVMFGGEDTLFGGVDVVW